MAVSVRPSSEAARRGRRTRAALLLAAGVALAGAGACTETLEPLTGTTSLEVTIVSPTELGSEDARLPDTARDVTIQVRARDTRGELDASFAGTVAVHAHFLGGLTPSLSAFDPLALIEVSGGESAPASLTLPPVFGPTFLWVEDTRGDSPTFATGTSPRLWYRDPFLADVSRPDDETALDAFEASPLELKQINVTGSRYGANGRLIVTGTYAQGYTLADVECRDAAGTPPCTTGDYDSIFVFSFSRPADTAGRPLAVGDRIARLTGAISEFNGLTEVNFPRSFRATTDGGVPVPTAPEQAPAPVTFDAAWLTSKIEMERNEAALIEIVGATVCPMDKDFDTFAQWKLDVGLGCPPADRTQNGKIINVITKGQVSDFAPGDHVGEVLPRLVGTLRPVQTSGGAFNVWIFYPRDADDIVLP
jgi:hypothetical protein